MRAIYSPYAPRPRCHLCKGKRVVLVDHIDYVEWRPCPVCHHTDPSATNRSAAEPESPTWAIAA